MTERKRGALLCSPPQSGCAGQLSRQGGAMMARPGSGGGKPDGRPKAAPTSTVKHWGRGGLRPPAVPTRRHAVCGARRPRRAKPRRDVHRPGGGEVEAQPLPVPPAQAVTAGAGPQRGRKDGSRRRTPHSAPTLKSPFFFGFQKPFLFPAGKKKWVLKASPPSLCPKRLPQSPSVTAPSEREPDASALRPQNDRGKRGTGPGGQRPPLPHPCGEFFVGAACGRPPWQCGTTSLWGATSSSQRARRVSRPTQRRIASLSPVILRPQGRRIRNLRPSAFLLRKRTGETDSSPSAQNDKGGRSE